MILIIFHLIFSGPKNSIHFSAPKKSHTEAPGGFEALHGHLQPPQLSEDGQRRRVAVGAAGDLL